MECKPLFTVVSTVSTLLPDDVTLGRSRKRGIMEIIKDSLSFFNIEADIEKYFENINYRLLVDVCHLICGKTSLTQIFNWCLRLKHKNTLHIPGTRNIMTKNVWNKHLLSLTSSIMLLLEFFLACLLIRRRNVSAVIMTWNIFKMQQMTPINYLLIYLPQTKALCLMGGGWWW